MNTKAVLFFVVGLVLTPDFAKADDKKPGRRAKAQQERKDQKERRAKAPRKRFDDGSRGTVHYTFQYMTYQELEESKQKLIAEKNYDAAIEYGKQQVAIATDTETHLVPDVLLEMADLLYAKKDYDKAWRAYAQWALQYPGANKKIASEIQKTQHELGVEIAKTITLIQGAREHSQTELIVCTQSEHAAFRAVDAAYRCTQDPDRDQTHTLVTIELADKFLQNKDRFRTHKITVDSIRTACYEKLITSELNICSFYRQQGEHEVTKNRLALLETEYGSKFPASKNLVTAYRTNHYGQPGEAKVEMPTLITESTTPKTHAADRF